MQIDWTAFSPASAAAGGALIGVDAVMFAVLGGRVAGISGIVAGAMRPQAGDLAWRLAFVAGLLAVALFASLSGALDIQIEASPTTLMWLDCWWVTDRDWAPAALVATAYAGLRDVPPAHSWQRFFSCRRAS